MQLRLLNFYRIIAKISTNVLGAFVALIVYKATGSFAWAFAYIAGMNFLKLFFEKVLNKWFQSHPQLALLLRAIPVLLYTCSLLLIDTELKQLGVVSALVFQALSEAMGTPPIEYIYSYSAEGRSSTSTAVTRIFEITGWSIAILLGGILLDYVDMWIVIVVAISIYLVSVIPLVIYAIKNRKNKYFNKEVTSNATETYSHNEEKQRQYNAISRKILNKYFFVYLLMCFYDVVMKLISLYVFKENEQMYSLVAYIQVAYYTMYGAGSLVAALLDQKIDLTNMVIVSCLLGGAVIIVSPFVVGLLWLQIVLYGVAGFCLSVISLFVYSRMMTRCKILGISNKALFNRERSTLIAQGFMALICIPSVVMFVPAFFIIGSASFLNAIVIPKNEEIVRKLLVDYLQNNGMY